MNDGAATRVPRDEPLRDRAQQLGPELVKLRRDLHRHPELSYREERTAAIAAKALAELGMEPRTGVARTGVVGEMVAGPGPEGDQGPTVALRADMDALPIQEENETDYTSTVPGAMHACGHDAHTAALVGAARILAREAREGRLPPGRLRFLFQPAEEGMDDEGKSGGRRMVEEGALEGVDAVVGAHVGAHLDPGKVYLRPGPFFAGSDEFQVEVRGESAHAARPHEGVDAVVLTAQGVVAAQQAVSRRIDPMEPGVLTFGTISGGTVMNVLADRVTLTGTLRYFAPEVRDRLRETLRGAFQGLEALGARSQVTVVPGYPPVVNEARATEKVLEAFREELGPEVLGEVEPVLLAEDFSYMAGKAAGVFFWVGAGLPERREHHHPRFDIDESALPLAAAALATAARTLLRGPGHPE